MQVTKKRRLMWLAVPLCLSLVAAACGDDDDDSGTGGGEGTSINVSGSSTVEPISAIAGEEFFNETGTDVRVEGPGTGDGFAEFCKGNTDISDASRTIKEEEAADCEQAGIEYVEIEVGIDGMAVMTNTNNDAVECLSFADLYALVGPEANGISDWADGMSVAGELGSSTELPAETLDLTGPGAESGTYDSFIEIALEGIAEERGQEPTTRSDYEANSDDNIIIQNIQASDYSLGWVGWSFASQAENVKNLQVSEEPGGECVEPSDETIASGDYPLSRSLYIYVNKAKAEENSALVDFVDFYLGDLNTWVEEAGYVALPDDRVDASTSAWEGR